MTGQSGLVWTQRKDVAACYVSSYIYARRGASRLIERSLLLSSFECIVHCQAIIKTISAPTTPTHEVGALDKAIRSKKILIRGNDF